jgi:hypothetical protein
MGSGIERMRRKAEGDSMLEKSVQRFFGQRHEEGKTVLQPDAGVVASESNGLLSLHLAGGNEVLI